MARDKYHELVRKSLEDEGWLITDDPLYVNTQKRQVKIDLAAERLIGAEKGDQKIAVEIKASSTSLKFMIFTERWGRIYITV